MDKKKENGIDERSGAEPTLVDPSMAVFSQTSQPHSVSGEEALQRLRDGNMRFSNNVMSLDNLATGDRRKMLLARQNPFAIILSCSDSRAPSEMLFDQGLGDLFVIRVAGNVVAPSIIGSVEFAASKFGSPLVVVMGHSQCGAIIATLDALRSGRAVASENIHDIVERISTPVETVLEAQLHRDTDPNQVLHQCVLANIRYAVQHLRHGSRILEELVSNNRLKIVGAHYCLETGVVEFLEEKKFHP